MSNEINRSEDTYKNIYGLYIKQWAKTSSKELTRVRNSDKRET